MVEAMRHRGPDDAGITAITAGNSWIGLGNTRLAILDLSQAGHMPMHDPNSGNWITYNGEVYNFLELRGELEAVGESFSSATDTEVVLKAYGRWGYRCLERLRGMFAIAIWDQRQQELILARDRLGKKPLYYFSDTYGNFLFASELRSILASRMVERRLDVTALEVFLFNGFMISPCTMVSGLRSLLPGSWMRVGPNGRIMQLSRYWRLPHYQDSCRDEEELLWELRTRLEEAVKLRLVSDVPLGVFLSGGMDSSAIVALMARFGADIRSLSITFDEAGFDESPFSEWVARRFRTRHTEIRLREQHLQEWLPDALAAMDQPSFDGINTYCISRAAKACGLTVALSGLGSDEVFGGYPFFNSVPWLSRVGLISEPIPHASLFLAFQWLGRRAVGCSGILKCLEILFRQGEMSSQSMVLPSYQTAQLLYPWWIRQRLLAGHCTNGSLKTWFGLPLEFCRFIIEEQEDGDLLNQISHHTLRLFLGERCLRDTDTNSMAVSLEVRAPFTDHIFLETAWKVPGKARCAKSPDKPFEWELVRPYLGADYPVRSKQGFTFPL